MIYLHDEPQIKAVVANRDLKIAFIGLGRVGLPLAATLADAGFTVNGIDINPRVVDAVNNATSPYPDERGLTELIQKTVSSGKLCASTDYAVIRKSDIIIIAVPTLIEDQKPDISAIHKVAERMNSYMDTGKVVVLQSTVPPETTQSILGEFTYKNIKLEAGIDFGLVYSPERTQSPQVVADLKSYPKIIGAIDDKSALVLSEVYKTFAPSVIRMKNIVAAELEKVMENTYRDVNIAFANEMALLCQLYGIDVQELITVANSQPFSHILQPGLVGGHCIPMDPYYAISDAASRGFDTKLIRTARELNEDIFTVITDMVPNEVQNVTILGLSFKPGVKSFETSHTPRLVKKLEERGLNITVHDPYLENTLYNFKTEANLCQAITGADCLILSTAHEQYKTLDLTQVKSLMNGDLVIDIRAFWEPEEIKQYGFKYKGLGRMFND